MATRRRPFSGQSSAIALHGDGGSTALLTGKSPFILPVAGWLLLHIFKFGIGFSEKRIPLFGPVLQRGRVEARLVPLRGLRLARSCDPSGAHRGQYRLLRHLRAEPRILGRLSPPGRAGATRRAGSPGPPHPRGRSDWMPDAGRIAPRRWCRRATERVRPARLRRPPASRATDRYRPGRDRGRPAAPDARPAHRHRQAGGPAARHWRPERSGRGLPTG